MSMVDLITAINLVLCVVILALGYMKYRKSKNNVPLYIGIAFGLFGISHAINFIGITDVTDALLVIRTLGYLTVVYALLSFGKGQKSRKKRKR